MAEPYKETICKETADAVMGQLHNLHLEVLRARDELAKARQRAEEAEIAFEKGLKYVSGVLVYAPKVALDKAK